MLNIGDRYRLFVALAFAIPIGYYMAVDTVKRYDVDGMKLATGQIVREIPSDGIRPIVEIRIDGQPTKVQACLMMNSVENMPRAVSFYFDGKPNGEIHCREETNPVWFLLLCVVVPIGLLVWDSVKRVDARDVAELFSNQAESSNRTMP